MLDEIANFIGPLLIPRVPVVAGVDNENVTFFDFDILGDGFR